MAKNGHKRDTNARFIPSFSSLGSARIAAPVAALATLAVVSIGVAGASPDVEDVVAKDAPAAAMSQVVTQERKRQVVSRSGGRSGARGQDVEVEQVRHSATYAARAEAAATRKAVAGADTKLWAIEDLNLWNGPTDEAANTGLLESGKSVLATGRERNGRTEVVVSDKSRWVTTGFLSDEKPVEPEPEAAPDAESGSTTAERSAPESGTDGTCTNGSSVSGSANVIEVHRAVCAQFPSITNYGTYRGDGEHAQGRAIDIMISGATGWNVAEFVRANAGSLGVEYIIYSQKIWSVDRSGEGWRPMEDRGSATANHYDHVHVTTY